MPPDRCESLLWVPTLRDDGVMAFTDFGIETLFDLIKNLQGRS